MTLLGLIVLLFFLSNRFSLSRSTGMYIIYYRTIKLNLLFDRRLFHYLNHSFLHLKAQVIFCEIRILKFAIHFTNLFYQYILPSNPTSID